MSEQETSREDLLTRYRGYRQAIQLHLNAAVNFLSVAMIKEASRRIGLLSANTIVADHFSEMTLALDLAVFGQKPGRSRAIDRYAQATPFPDDSVEAVTLAALRANSFRVVRVKERHPIAGLIVHDLAHREELWLMDEGLEASSHEGAGLAARLIPLETFHTTAGAIVPVAEDMFKHALHSLAARRGKLDFSALDDPRLPEALYAAAISSNAMEYMAYAEDD
jgi:hypothetical protein